MSPLQRGPSLPLTLVCRNCAQAFFLVQRLEQGRKEQPDADHGSGHLIGKQLPDSEFKADWIGRFNLLALFGALSQQGSGGLIGAIGV